MVDREDKQFSLIDIKLMRGFRKQIKQTSPEKKEAMARLGGPSFFEKDQEKWLQRYDKADSIEEAD